MQEIRIHSPQEMFHLGEKLAQTDPILLLHGDLGAGKTTLVQGFAKGIGIDKTNISSPTYTYVHIYDNKLLHVDMYRIQNQEYIVQSGIWELLQTYEYIAIEWPKFIETLPIQGTIVTIDIQSSTCRKVTIERSYSPKS